MSTLNSCLMEEIPSGSLNVCNQLFSTSNVPSTKTIQCFSNGVSSKETENSETFLSCRKAFNLFPNGKIILKNWKATEKEKDDSFLKLVRDQHWQLRDIEINMQCDYIVLQKQNKNQYKLLFDNRFLIQQRKKKKNQFVGIILNQKGALVQTIFRLSQMPVLKIKPLNPEEPLWKLVDLQKEQKNPTTYQETLQFFETNEKLKEFRLDYHTSLECWIFNDRSRPNIEAFTKNDYTLGFRWLKPIPVFKIRKPKPMLDVPIEYNEFQTNNSAAVKVRMSGLNQAYNLGCLTLQEFHNLSNQLAETIASLWIELDDQNEARFATYKDDTRECHFELNKDEKTWITMFDYISKCQLLISTKKSTILSDVVQRLQLFPGNVTNPWKNCLLSLKKCIREMKVAVYSVEDTVLHAIKAYYCFYADQKCKKNFRGVSLNSNAKNDLTTIKTPGLMFFNFGSYLTMNTSAVDATLPIPNIKNSVQSIKRQNVQNQMSMLNLCRERGKCLSRQLRRDCIENGKHFLKFFNYDIFSLPYISLSSLAFNTIWHKYTQRAGTFHQGLEKTKLYQEKFLRNYCRGGFSYSCKDQLNCGDPLNPSLDKNYLAKSIQEFDLISSYGYAASNMKCPVGFCTGYANLNNKHKILTKVDRKLRFQSFEFLSVYTTLWKLEKEDGVKIKTVYSNFHQYGFLQLGKLTLDLVVITEEGKIIMFAFDGAWVHGCRLGCANLQSYAGNQSRLTLEQKSQERDDVINAWCQELNKKTNVPNFATYKVIADCHDSNYDIKNMMEKMNRPELKHLIFSNPHQNYMYDEAFTLEVGPESTFIAVVDGHCPKNTKPLLLLTQKNQWKQCNSTELTHKGMLLTQDFYKYLQREHNFVVDKIHKIYFYRNCTVLPQIFKELVETRMNPLISPEEKQLLKNIVNYSAGFFGYNEQKHETKSVCRLVTRVPARYGHEHYFKSRLSDVTVVRDTRIMFLQTTKRIRKKTMSCQSAFPLYICITEWGKKRMSEVFNFFNKFLDPRSYRILYSNIDNVIIAFATETMEEASNQIWPIDVYKSELFSTTQPGYLKQEFCFTSNNEWKFVSGFTQNYAILTNQIETGIHKTAALNRISTRQAFDASCALLKSERFSIEQCRRINKMANMDTEVQIFHF